MDLYETIQQYIENGKKGVIATVIYRAGSAPRDVGAKMFVGDDGTSFGTVGGGRLEADTHAEALRTMDSTEAKIFSIRMDGNTVAGEGMLCGGNVDILLEPLDKGYIEVYRKIGQLEKIGRKGVVATRYGHKPFSKTLIEQSLETTGAPLGREEIERFCSHIDEKRPVVIDGTVIEPLQAYAVLYIFGAGHVSQYLARIAKMVDFRVVVIDDRKEFANKERFPEADEIIVEDFSRVFDGLEFTGSEFTAIITRGHKHDAQVLEAVLRKPVKYIGMIGSRRKIAIVFDYLKESGFDDEALRRVCAPIGIDINAETPQEIAVSIAAELINKRGEH